MKCKHENGEFRGDYTGGSIGVYCKDCKYDNNLSQFAIIESKSSKRKMKSYLNKKRNYV